MPARHERQPAAPTGVTGPIATAMYVKIAQNVAKKQSAKHRKRRKRI